MALKNKQLQRILLFSSRNEINTSRRFEIRSGRQLKWIEHEPESSSTGTYSRVAATCPNASAISAVWCT